MIPRKNQPSEHGGNLKITVNSDISFSEAVGKLREEYQAHKYLTVSINTGKKRTLSQNALMHEWFGCVSKELGDCFPDEVKRLCKYHKGIPILRAIEQDKKSKDVAKVCDFCEKTLDHYSYEDKIASMEFLPISSLMNTEQLSEYLTAIQYNYSLRGVILYWPDDWEEGRDDKTKTAS